MTTVRKYGDLDALSNAAADELAAIAKDAVAQRGVCTIALSGGSTPKRLFQLLAGRGRDALPWDQIELWWGDERTVPPDHADSNYRMAREALVDPLRLDAQRVHRMPAEEPDHELAALTYERALVAALGTPPVIDYMMLGMGPDGHTASLFPGSPGLDEHERWVIANPVDSPLAKGKTTRITMTVPAICAARHIRFLVAGGDKANALHAVLEGPRDSHRYPSQLISPLTGDLAWLVDQAAAARLGGSS
jgi:6-phosphogluconolactonase